MSDPTNWNADAEVGSFAFASPEEAKKAEAVMNKALRESFENGINVGLEEAAQIVGAHAQAYDELQAAHHRQTPSMFDPKLYGIDMEVVKWSRDAAMKVRSFKRNDAASSGSISTKGE